MELKLIRVNVAPEIAGEIPMLVSDVSTLTGVLGFFDHFSGLMVVLDEGLEHLRADPVEFYELLASHVKELPSDRQLPFLVSHTALFHELQHFRDCFCTPLGVQLLEEYLVGFVLRVFLVQEVIGARAVVGLPTTQPIREYLGEKACPAFLRDLAKHVAQRSLSLAVNIGKSPLVTLDGHDFEHDFAISCFRAGPCDEYYEVPCVIYNCLSERRAFRVLWPIGFCLLTECLAVLVQGTHIGSAGHRFRIEFRESLKVGFSPYTALLGALIKVFKTRGYVPDDKDIYRCVLRALLAPHTVELAKKDEQATVKSIGWGLLEILQNYVEIRKSKYRWCGPEVDRDRWIEVPSRLRGVPFDLLDLISRNYLSKAMSLTLPQGFTYDDYDMHLFLETKLPPPPFLVTPSGRLSIIDVEFYERWVNWLMAQSVGDGAFWYGKFVCPVRDPSTSWLFPRDDVLPSGSECSQGLKRSSCGVWSPNLVYRGPICHWSSKMAEMLMPYGGRFVGENTKRANVQGPWVHAAEKGGLAEGS